ncbi:MAG: hypothetical protein AAGA48_03665 [Myxococcota bacterium]
MKVIFNGGVVKGVWTTSLGATAYSVGSLFAAFVFAVIVAGGATQWLPEGAAKIDHIVLPILAFPAVWITFGLVLYAARHRLRAWGVIGGITVVHAALIVYRFATT